MYEPFPPLTPPGASQPPAAPVQPPVATYDPVAPAQAAAVDRAPRTRRTVGPAFVIAAALGSALLASGTTYALVGATNHTGAPAPVSGTAQLPAGQNASTGSAAGSQSPVVDIVKAVSPAVVTIVADGVTSTDPTTGQTGTGTATGSGVIFDSNGLILTNHHVVAGDPKSLTVHLKDG